MISGQRIAEISEALAERLLALGDEPSIGKCHRIQFKIKTRDDNPTLCEGDGGGMIHEALRSWFSRELADLLGATINIKHVFAITFRSAGVRNYRDFHREVDSHITANVLFWKGADSHVNEQLSGYEVAPALYMPEGKMMYEMEVLDMEAENETAVAEELLRCGFTEVK